MHYRPTAAQLLLLRAATASPQPAAEAWHQWSADHSPAHIDEYAARLLPAVAARVVVGGPLTGELARVHRNRRHTWAENTVRASRSEAVAQALTGRGIQSVFLKGLGVLPFYADPATRRMSDADLLVPWALRHEAIDVLAGEGFAPLYGWAVDSMHRIDDVYPGFGMERGDGFELDLHWRPLHRLPHHPAADEVLFERASVRAVASASLRVPHPAHQLVLVLGHGLRTGSGAHLMALVDATELLRSAEFEAELAASLAARYERTSTLRDACAVLDEVFRGAHDDDSVFVRDQVQALRARLRRRSVGDRLAARELHASGEAPRQRARVVRDIWVAATTTPLRSGGAAAGVAHVLRRRWGVARLRHLPAQALWLAGRRSPLVARWRRTGINRAPQRRTLTIGQRVNVGPDEPVNDLVGGGWWPQESDHVWSRAPEAALDLDIDLAGADGCELVLDVRPYVAGDDHELFVDVRVNGRRAAGWHFRLGAHLASSKHLRIDRADLHGRRCEVVFVIRRATSPLLSGAGTDDRVLGIALASVAVQPIPETH